MTVAELMEILQECDPECQVGFVEKEVVTSIGFVEVKVEPQTEPEVFLYESEPHWPDFDLYAIKTLATNGRGTFAKNVYTKLSD